MLHRNKEHSGNVIASRHDINNTCTRTEESCWYSHKQNIVQTNKSQVFQKAMEGTIPPEPAMRDLIKIIMEKLDALEVRTKSLVQ